MFRHRCTPSERLLALVNDYQQGEGTIASGIRCRGRLDAKKIRDVLDRLQARHPKLRARIEYDQDQWPSFVELDPAAPIPCEFREMADPADAQQALLGEWTDRFPMEQGPLLSVLVLFCPETDTTDVIGRFPHVAFDALSVWRFFEEFLAAYGDAEAYQESAPGGFEVLPAGREGSWGDLAWFAKLFCFRLIVGRLQRTVSFRDRAVGQLAHVNTVFSADQTRRLVEACRQENVSVTGALSTAACTVLARECGWHGRLIAMPTPRDARAEMAPPVEPGTLGCFATTYEAVVRLPEAGAEFWESARKQTAESQRQFQWKDPVRGLKLIRHIPAKAVMRTGVNRAALFINNHGRISLGGTPGSPEVLGLDTHVRAETCASSVTLTALTVDDRMTLLLSAACFDQASLARLLQEIEATLTLAAAKWTRDQTDPADHHGPDVPGEPIAELVAV